MENLRLRDAAPTLVNVTVGKRSREYLTFVSERRAPLSVAGYQRMVARAGLAAKFTFLVHSHMLRHACGFKLANDGHDTRAIQANVFRVAEPAAGDETHPSCCRLLARSSRRQMCAAHQH